MTPRIALKTTPPALPVSLVHVPVCVTVNASLFVRVLVLASILRHPISYVVRCSTPTKVVGPNTERIVAGVANYFGELPSFREVHEAMNFPLLALIPRNPIPVVACSILPLPTVMGVHIDLGPNPVRKGQHSVLL